MKQQSNKLINEKSPYLLQHAHNPVDWHPWNNEAFEKAEREDKPVFLSIGYSTCHWCHVMERESFEDEEVANLMNDTFVSIKVDREERPDIDNIYMTICQMMTGGGGWPLSVVLTPDKRPFFSGTYFPKESRYGRVGFKDLIISIKDAWTNRRSEIEESASQITTFFRDNIKTEPGEEITEEVLDDAYEYFKRNFDDKYGGFGNAPKFPSPHNLLFLMNYYQRTDDSEGLKLAEITLDRMRLGGIWDHIGYGFHRYSTDREWLLPHFEKMLYDQAMLMNAYTSAYLFTNKSDYKETALNIYEYVIRDMTYKEGGFFTAEDADSEGIEGKFYVWSTEELSALLSNEEYDLLKSIYNIEENGNFQEEATRSLTGDNILHLGKPLTDYTADTGWESKELTRTLKNIQTKLFAVREKRIHPHKDNKILTDWNGLMIAALAKAGFAFGNTKLIESAESAAAFILKNMYKSNKLLHRYRNGEASIKGNLDDYAFTIWGMLELYSATFKPAYLEMADKLLSKSVELFWDEQAGGFFFTEENSNDLIARTKEDYDAAIPAGNSVMLHNLIKLYRLTAKPYYQTLIDKLTKAFSGKVIKAPQAYTHLLSGINELYNIKTKELVIIGSVDNETVLKVLNAVRESTLSVTVVLVTPGSEESLFETVPYLKDYNQLEDKPTFYVCSNFVCEQPTTDPNQAIQLLSA